MEYSIYENPNLRNTDFRSIDSGNGKTISTSINITPGTKYYLRINFPSKYVGGTVNITIEHNHRYSYEPCGSLTHHLSVCDCGFEYQGRHVVEQTTAARAPCIRCGQLVRVGDAVVGILGDVNLPEVA